MGRQYKINNISYPSVTSIIGLLDKSAALMPWAVRLAVTYCEDHKDEPDVFEKAKIEWRTVSETAKDIGSEVHGLIERYIKDGKDAVGEMRPEVENAFLAFLEWESEHIAEWKASELTVHSDNGHYAGTLDAVALLKDGRTVVIDFKSSKGFFDGYDLQVAAYRAAWEEMSNQKVDGQMVLRLDKATGKPDHRDYSEDHKRNLSCFKHLTQVYYLMKNRRLKNNPIAAELKK